ncbi:MAG: 30S ribosomal protein S27ae [Candidatus Aenigmatarchaeota archaeon]|nr:MAG: 30S ribosomal protein S27ae [Candidatus Aenigmarchaeota archaeon]RLJ08278.1 MAG: 30S ribosomal protein S27ae [Candidatus Aenigmarchaeota archaeon]
MGGQEGGRKSKIRKRERKQRTGKKHLTVKPNSIYKVEGGKLIRNRKTCPRCGDGTFLAHHKDRYYCGRCGYTVFEKKQTQ